MIAALIRVVKLALSFRPGREEACAVDIVIIKLTAHEHFLLSSAA